MQPLASIPSPPYGVIHLGPLPLRAYALMIILGVVVAVWLGERRWVARGGTAGTVVDIAVWAVPFGLVGARLYHVITDHQRYFGAGQHPVDALKIWTGGLGIWGGVALGTLGAYIACRRRGISLRVFADAAAPGIALAQGIGRWGNWFNQELYGRPLHTFWALSIDRDHRPLLADGTPDPKYADIATYHPTFLYESLWCIGVAVLVIWAERRFRLTYGRTFALYVAAYTVGRAWIEALRIDAAHHVFGLRLNDWTSLIVFLAAVAYLYLYRDRAENPASAYGTAARTPALDAGETAASALETVEDPAAAPEDAPAEAEPQAEADDIDVENAEQQAADTDVEQQAETDDTDVEQQAETDDTDVEPRAEADEADVHHDSEADVEDAEDGDVQDAEDTDGQDAEDGDGRGDEEAAREERTVETNGSQAAKDETDEAQSEAATRGSGP